MVILIILLISIDFRRGRTGPQADGVNTSGCNGLCRKSDDTVSSGLLLTCNQTKLHTTVGIVTTTQRFSIHLCLEWLY
jgi:hypothetical protein